MKGQAAFNEPESLAPEKMNPAAQSAAGPRTLTLTRRAFGILDGLRGEMPKSAFVEELLIKKKKRREREAFHRTVIASYTPDVRLETLKLNKETPVAAE